LGSRSFLHIPAGIQRTYLPAAESTGPIPGHPAGREQSYGYFKSKAGSFVLQRTVKLRAPVVQSQFPAGITGAEHKTYLLILMDTFLSLTGMCMYLPMCNRFKRNRPNRVTAFLIRRFAISIMILCSSFFAASAQATAVPPGSGNDTLVFLSDTQAPLFAETILHRTPFNQRATQMIFDDILAKRPGNVFMLGDLVAAGSKPRRWMAVDRFLQGMRKGGSKVWGCLGNHEYLYTARSGLHAFQQRFPEHSKTGYYIIRDSVAVVLLNSNFSKLTEAERLTQQRFYTSALAALDKNDSVRAIIVTCHHSPYSNSKVVGSNRKAREAFVTPFLKTAKGKLFLSGHSHNFEHFKIEGKTFLVIGGGGGISQNLNTKADRIVCENDDCHPSFHYLMVKRAGDHFFITCREVKPDLKGMNDVLTLRVGIIP
jgi:predicted MPP superfamily phosphohydrolase